MAASADRESGLPRRAQLALKRGLRLYVMADRSGVLADAASGDAHALNAEATRLLGAGIASADADPLRPTLDLEAAESSRFVEQLRALGLIVADDD